MIYIFNFLIIYFFNIYKNETLYFISNFLIDIYPEIINK